MLKYVQPEELDREFTIRDLEFTANISYDQLDANLRAAIARKDAAWLKDVDAHSGTALIIAGGPSLAGQIKFIQACQRRGEVIFAVNNVPAYLEQFGIVPDCHVLLDSLPSVAEFVAPHLRMTRYYSSQCAPSVHDAAPCILWTPYIVGLSEAFPELKPPFVGGGTTVGTRAIGLAYQLGYRRMRIFGLDSSQANGASHAYAQGDYEHFLDVRCGERTFKCPPQMLAQAEEFQHVAFELLNNGCDIAVYGDGLLQTVAAEMAKQLSQGRNE